MKKCLEDVLPGLTAKTGEMQNDKRKPSSQSRGLAGTNIRTEKCARLTIQ